MKTVWSDTFYGDVMLELVWRLSGVFIEKTWQMKLPNSMSL